MRIIDHVATSLMFAFVIAGTPAAGLLLGFASMIGLWRPAGNGTSGDLGLFFMLAFVFGVAEAVALGGLLGFGMLHLPHVTVEWR